MRLYHLWPIVLFESSLSYELVSIMVQIFSKI